MTREILFRGKRTDNGEWVEGNLAVDKDRCYICRAISDLGISYGDNGTRMRIGCWVPVDPSTVGQYTGLKDKNGKRIFEGDIVKAIRICNREAYTGVVVWWRGCFAIRETRTNNVPAIDLFDTLEIIGNVHDNTELIGGNDET